MLQHTDERTSLLPGEELPFITAAVNGRHKSYSAWSGASGSVAGEVPGGRTGRCQSSRWCSRRRSHSADRQVWCWTLGNVEISLLPVVVLLTLSGSLVPLIVPGSFRAWWALLPVGLVALLLALMLAGVFPRHLGFGPRGDKSAMWAVFLVLGSFLCLVGQGAVLKAFNRKYSIVGHQVLPICQEVAGKPVLPDDDGMGRGYVAASAMLCWFHGRAVNIVIFAIGAVVFSSTARYLVSVKLCQPPQKLRAAQRAVLLCRRNHNHNLCSYRARVQPQAISWFGMRVTTRTPLFQRAKRCPAR
jgi:hypothetical protein